MTDINTEPYVERVAPHPDFTADVLFRGIGWRRVDLRPLLDEPPYDRISDVSEFMMAESPLGILSWGELYDEVDIAGETLLAMSVPSPWLKG